MHVCHLVHHLANGGLEQQVYQLVKHGSSEVTYTVCYLGDDDSLAPDVRAAGGTVVDLDIGSWGRKSVFDPRATGRLAGFLRNGQFDVLHVHSPLYVHVLGRVAASLVGPDLVVGTYHNPSDNFHPAMRLLERGTRPLSSVNVGVSDAVERSFTGAGTEYTPGTVTRRSYTIHNGIDVDQFATRVANAHAAELIDEHDLGGKQVFLNIGRYAPQKRQQDLITAMSTVVEEVSDVHLFIVGWGPLEDDLRQSVRDLGLESHVTVTGKVPTVEQYYAVADVFVLSSAWEGMSIVLLEAMAAGLPIVTTDVPGVPELMNEGENGFIVPPGSPSALASRMLDLNRSSELDRFGTNSHERVSELFDIRRTGDLYTSLYRNLVDSA